jgi:hypothetical protein
MEECLGHASGAGVAGDVANHSTATASKRSRLLRMLRCCSLPLPPGLEGGSGSRRNGWSGQAGGSSQLLRGPDESHAWTSGRATATDSVWLSGAQKRQII